MQPFIRSWIDANGRHKVELYRSQDAYHAALPMLFGLLADEGHGFLEFSGHKDPRACHRDCLAPGRRSQMCEECLATIEDAVGFYCDGYILGTPEEVIDALGFRDTPRADANDILVAVAQFTKRPVSA